MKATSFVVAPNENFPLSLFAKTTNFLGQNEIADLSLTQHKKKSTKVFFTKHESSKVSKKDFELLLYLEFFFNVGTLFVRLDLIQFDDTRVQSVTVILFFSIIFDSAKLVVATLALNKVFRAFVVCNAV